jgi:GrpB-like predicted nucleotidyltransferase (UPF0157 family)
MPKPSQRRILVMDYDPTWRVIFVTLQAPILEALRGVALSVEHIGSTSVPGLAAKPIIDIDVVVPSRTKMSATIERLAKLGYVHRGNLGIENREAFGSPTGLPAHHLYACVQGSAALANHLAVRDYLRRDPAAAAAYGKLKRQLAEQFPTDVESYVAGKTDFLIEILGRVSIMDAVLPPIRNANQGK